MLQPRLFWRIRQVAEHVILRKYNYLSISTRTSLPAPFGKVKKKSKGAGQPGRF
jgi:hypothetical protein